MPFVGMRNAECGMQVASSDCILPVAVDQQSEDFKEAEGSRVVRGRIRPAVPVIGNHHHICSKGPGRFCICFRSWTPELC